MSAYVFGFCYGFFWLGLLVPVALMRRAAFAIIDD